MLKIIEKMCDLDSTQLMAVYSESNLENGRWRFPDLPEDEQIRKAESGFLTYLREDFFGQKNAIYAVWEVERQYRSALRIEPYRDGLLLEALETAPAERRKGYAESLVRAVLCYLQQTEFTAVYSHVSKRNVQSLSVHRKCGFRRVSDTAAYIDGTVTNNACTLCYQLADANRN